MPYGAWYGVHMWLFDEHNDQTQVLLWVYVCEASPHPHRFRAIILFHFMSPKVQIPLRQPLNRAHSSIKPQEWPCTAIDSRYSTATCSPEATTSCLIASSTHSALYSFIIGSQLYSYMLYVWCSASYLNLFSSGALTRIIQPAAS